MAMALFRLVEHTNLSKTFDFLVRRQPSEFYLLYVNHYLRSMTHKLRYAQQKQADIRYLELIEQERLDAQTIFIEVLEECLLRLHEKRGNQSHFAGINYLRDQMRTNVAAARALKAETLRVIEAVDDYRLHAGVYRLLTEYDEELG